MWGHKAATELSRRLAVILLFPKVNEPGVPGTGTCSAAASPKAPGTSATAQKHGAGGDAAPLTTAQTVRCATGPHGYRHLPVQHQSDGLLRESKVYHVPESNEPMVLQGRAWKRILQQRAAKGVIASYCFAQRGAGQTQLPKRGFHRPPVQEQHDVLIPTHCARPNSACSSQPIVLVPTHQWEPGSAWSPAGLAGGDARGVDVRDEGRPPRKGNTVPCTQGQELGHLTLHGRTGIGLGSIWPIPKPGCNSHWCLWFYCVYCP